MRPLLPRLGRQTTCHVGAGVATRLADEMLRLGGCRAFVVATRSLAAHPVLRDATARLEAAGLETTVFAEATEESSERVAREGLSRWRKTRADVLVSIGGGAAHDLAKLVGILATSRDPLDALAEGARLRDPLPPHVALNTTTGTGAEMSRFALLAARDGRRVVLDDAYLRPRVALNDPEVHASQPASLTAAGALHLVARATGALLAPRASPLASALALDAVALVATHLDAVLDDGSDRDARAGLAWAEQKAGLACDAAGLWLLDAMSLAVAGTYPVTRGVVSAVLLPYVVAYELRAGATRLAPLAEALLGADAPREPEERMRILPAALTALGARAGMPGSLRGLGVDDPVADGCVRATLANPLANAGPRPATEAGIAEILAEARDGAGPAEALRVLAS